MRSFKKIKLNPLTNFEDLNLKVVSKKSWDITSLSLEKQKEAVAGIMKAIHNQYKGIGVIIAGGKISEAAHVMTQIKGGQNKKKIFSFAEPNPVRLYYRNANIHLEEAYINKIAFQDIPENNQVRQAEVFTRFFSEMVLGIVSLIMTVEGFINQLLSENITYTIDGQQKSKKDIEWMDFNTKIREVIPEISGINYVAKHPAEYSNLSNANSLRDNLIHLKKLETQNVTYYQTLFKTLLDFDPVNASDAVFHFTNTIQPGYFEEETIALA